MALSVARTNADRYINVNNQGALIICDVFAILTAEVHHEAEAEEEKEGVFVCCFDSCSETVSVSST